MMKNTFIFKTVLVLCLMATSWLPMHANDLNRGDCNGDGSVNITDVTCLIDYLLGNEQSSFVAMNADVDFDSSIDIKDVTKLIDYLLSGSWPWTPPEIETEDFDVNGVTFKMVKVTGGSFTMGARDDEPEAEDFERPAHPVTLSDYMIGETEVTQALWLAVMGYSPDDFNEDPNSPVENVSWEECQAFIYQLNQMTGRKFRLPTEAEWEFAARGGISSQSNRYAGSNNIDDVAWFIGNSGDTPHPVAGRSSNELGLYDMSGNVWEWCLDGFTDYNGVPQTDPVALLSQSGAVCRGGFYGSEENQCRVTQRMAAMTELHDNGIGLRLALDREDSPKFRVAEPVVSCEVDETVEVEILNGSGNYSVVIVGDEENVSVSISEKRLRISALLPGTVVAYITDDVYGYTAACTIVSFPRALNFVANGVNFTMILVPGCIFTMGATPEQWPFNPAGYEYQAHEVTLSSYYIAQTEVTQELWQAVMGYNYSYFTPGYSGSSLNLQRPAENVNWDDCQLFISRLNDLTGQSFRLPTEAEWECAARGGRGSRGYVYAGGNILNRVAWNYDNAYAVGFSSPDFGTHAVATKLPNELGLYDMSGNVREYCQDYFAPYFSENPVINPTGPTSGSGRVLRGGSWRDIDGCRVSARNYAYQAGCRQPYDGLRLALDVRNTYHFRFDNPVLRCKMNVSVTAEILDGSGSYTIADGLEGVTASINGNVMTVTGTAPGITTVHVIDNLTGETAVLTVIVESDVNEIEEFSVGDVTFKMVKVRGGSFMMGSYEYDAVAMDEEKPAHEVTLSDYSIGETEVTQALWLAVMGWNPSWFTSANGFDDDLNRPVENVSWYDCQTFISLLSQMTGRDFRLPTEAEWEFAGLGGLSGYGCRYAGSNNIDEVAWFVGNSGETPHPVAGRLCNELGLYDMSGNVWEWCQDGFAEYNADSQFNPVIPYLQTDIVCRGGYYGANDSKCRVKMRIGMMPTLNHESIGLRLAY